MAKSLLKNHRTSLLLWNAYAQIEWRGGSGDAARHIFSTAISMSGSFPESNRRDLIILWKTWAWEELMDGNSFNALKVLISIPNGKYTAKTNDETLDLGATAVLRSKRVSLQTSLN